MNAASAPAPIRAVIVDDEPLARDCVRIALDQHPSVRVVAECGDGESAVGAIREHEPDLVFLDVQMPGMDGFEVLEEIGVERMPAVVFVTAYDQHALRAFEIHAVDYVLKPFDDARFGTCVEHAIERVRESDAAAL
ncbi:MAG TPA: response regulator, partial [Longimicrobiales bacterium]|nr:response regulator [Longimicrobiales bacterium]